MTNQPTETLLHINSIRHVFQFIPEKVGTYKEKEYIIWRQIVQEYSPFFGIVGGGMLSLIVNWD